MSTLTLNLSEKLVKDIIESDASLKAGDRRLGHRQGREEFPSPRVSKSALNG